MKHSVLLRQSRNFPTLKKYWKKQMTHHSVLHPTSSPIIIEQVNTFLKTLITALSVGMMVVHLLHMHHSEALRKADSVAKAVLRVLSHILKRNIYLLGI